MSMKFGVCYKKSPRTSFLNLRTSSVISVKAKYIIISISVVHTETRSLVKF